MFSQESFSTSLNTQAQQIHFPNTMSQHTFYAMFVWIGTEKQRRTGVLLHLFTLYYIVVTCFIVHLSWYVSLYKSSKTAHS